MIKRALRKNLTRELRSTLSRFLAIFAITALGAGFYVGLKSTGPDMALTANQYYAQQRLADYRLLSTMGFTQGDITALRERGRYSAVMPTYGVDALVDSALGPKAVRLQGLPTGETAGGANVQNVPVLNTGRLPQKTNECLADSTGADQIGDVILLSGENTDETLEMFSAKEFTVVGTAHSPAYISFSRGITNIGSGSIEQFYLVPESAFSTDYYTEVFLRDAEAEGMNSLTDEYTHLTDTELTALETFGAARAALRYDDVLAEAEETLAEAETELADGRREYEEKRADAEAELADAEKTLREGQAKAADGRREIEKNAGLLADGRAQLSAGEAETVAARATLEENRAKLNAGQAELDKNQATLNTGKTQYEEGLAQYAQGLAQYNTGYAAYAEQRAGWQAGQDLYNTNLLAYQQGLAQYDAGLAQLVGLREAQAGLEGSLAQMGALQAAAAGGDPAATEQFTAIAAGSAGGLSALSGQLSGVDAGASAAFSGASGGISAALAGGDYAGATAALSAGMGVFPPLLAGLDARLSAAKAQLDTAKPPLEAAKAQLDAGQIPLDEAAATLAASKAQLNESKTLLDTTAATLAEGQAQLDAGSATLAAGRQALADGEAQLAAGISELAAARQTLADGQTKLNEARAQLADAEKELADGWNDYKEAKTEAEAEFKKAELELADGEGELADAKAELADLDPPEWFISNRESNPGYPGFTSDTHRIDSIALIFPVFFFLVATLICLTTMTRMVEENRTQIGTLKALGYSGSSIAFKYLFYGVVASLSGSVTGVLICSWVFPTAIWQAYSMMYVMPPIVTPLHPVHAPLSVIASVLCTLLATLAACLGELRSLPATLMRPKAPRPGKRIFLERIRPLWRRMSFTQKVTCRNLFRYKKRFFMTVVGVSGCTALLLTGFGLRDSINGIVTAQYGDINLYNVSAYLSNPSTAEADTPLNEVLPPLGESLYAEQTNVNVTYNGKNNADMTTYLHVAENAQQLSDFIVFNNPKTKEICPFPQGDGILITEKLAKRLGAGVGDVVELTHVDAGTAEATVAGVVENYVFNYVYIAPDTYEKLFGAIPEYNIVLLNFPQDDTLDEGVLLKTLVGTEGVAGAMDVRDLRAQFDDMMKSLNAVIAVVILSAGMLAFVVLYNLTNININERAREIATLKVLGFQRMEVASYIYRESLLLTLIGAGLGLLLGIVLHQFVISAAEIDEMMFKRSIFPLSYLWAVLFTVVSVAVVDVVMLRRLRRIDMIESLKSAE